MSRSIPDSELNTIAELLKRSPQGLSAAQILGALASPPAKRSLLLRLNHLEADGRLTRQGKGVATRYFSAPQPATAAAPLAPQEAGGIDLSPAGQAVRRHVTQPLTRRQPVGYQQAFLDTYVPNETFWLSAAQREELAALGQSGMGEVPAGTYLRQVMDRLLIDLSWNSSRLEGNTYSLLETRRLIELGEVAEGKDALEAQMLLNHKAAIEMLAERAALIGFNTHTICNLHALLADNLLSDAGACGRVRSRPVAISGTVFHPLGVPQDILTHFIAILDKAELIADPFEQALFAMAQLPYLQPFEDVNKRVSRLAANIPMVRRNLCPLSFVDVPKEDYVHALLGVYELNDVSALRDVFIWAYRRSAARYAAIAQSVGEPNRLRMRHREMIFQLVHDVVAQNMPASKASQYIAARVTAAAPPADAAKLIEMVETELLSLHDGNLTKYRLTPELLAAWRTAP